MIREALGMVTLLQVTLIAVIAACLVFAVALWRDEKRRRRRLEQRIAYKASMQPGWDAARREVGL